MQIGTTLYAPGNDSSLYATLVEMLGNLYFSQGYSYQQAINAIKNCSSADCMWQKLKNNQHNLQAQLTDFMPLYNTLMENFNLMVAYYNVPLNYYAPPANTQLIIQANSQTQTAFNNYLGKLYEQLGDDLQTFLIGDPLNQNYSTLLSTIATQYSTAALYYNTVNQLSALEQKTATVFKNAGDMVAATNNYFGAIGFYYTAEQAYEKIPSPSPNILQQLSSVYMTRLTAAFTGATNNMVEYQAAKATPIVIKLGSGQTESMTLDQLLQEYTTWLGQHGGQTTGFDVGKICKYNFYNGLILDALIFYTATSVEFNKKIKTAFGGNPTDDQLKTINQNGLNAINSYLSSKSISLDTVASIQQLMARPDFKDVLMQGFEQFKSMALANDMNSSLQGYSALAQWASKLNTAFGQIYMNDYLGGVSLEAWDNLSEALKAETDEIRAPSKYYVGDICQNYQ
ncbi:MAG TPA: hypothetical protein VHA52_00580 [Candidatus Babeliaceae bacterium]|nr:hypothetical protein [Candidatus Babeliaceae bacterium]